MSTLQILLDEREILRGLARFARVLDGKKWGELAEVFAEDLSFNYGSGGEERGMDALRSTMRRYLDICGGTQHLLGSITVEVDGDTAVSRAYVQARHQRVSNPAGPVFDSSGEYVDHWARLSQGWRIIRRDAIWLMHTGDSSILAADQSQLG